MGSNVNNLKPYFREDIENILKTIYFTHIASGGNRNNDYDSGFASAIASLSIMVGVSPKDILDKDVSLIGL